MTLRLRTSLRYVLRRKLLDAALVPSRGLPGGRSLTFPAAEPDIAVSRRPRQRIAERYHAA